MTHYWNMTLTNEEWLVSKVFQTKKTKTMLGTNNCGFIYFSNETLKKRVNKSLAHYDRPFNTHTFLDVRGFLVSFKPVENHKRKMFSSTHVSHTVGTFSP